MRGASARTRVIRDLAGTVDPDTAKQVCFAWIELRGLTCDPTARSPALPIPQMNASPVEREVMVFITARVLMDQPITTGSNYRGLTLLSP